MLIFFDSLLLIYTSNQVQKLGFYFFLFSLFCDEEKFAVATSGPLCLWDYNGLFIIFNLYIGSIDIVRVK